MPINPFVLLAAFLPLIGYLLLLSLVRVSGRVLVTTGGRDLAAVLLAIAGLVFVGPAELFFPQSTAVYMHSWTWVPLVILYGLVVSLLALTCRPKLVVYGRDPEEIFPALVRACRSMDASAVVTEHQWLVHLPTLQAHVRLDGVTRFDCLTIESFEPTLPTAFWNRLLANVRWEARTTRPPVRRVGWAMLAVAVLMLAIVSRHAILNPDQLVDGFRDWLIR